MAFPQRVKLGYLSKYMRSGSPGNVAGVQKTTSSQSHNDTPKILETRLPIDVDGTMAKPVPKVCV
jgi:hypothetical protein